MKIKVDIRLMAAVIVMVALLGAMIAVLYDTVIDHGDVSKPQETKPAAETGIRISDATAKEMNLKVEELAEKPIPIIVKGSAIITQNLDKMYVDVLANKAGKIKTSRKSGSTVGRGSVIASVDGSNITSSESGMVMDVWVSDGDTVYSGQKIATVMNLSNVWVLADIPQDQLSGLQTGQGVEIKVDAFPDKVFHSTVSYVSPTLNPNTFTASVRVVLPNPNLELKPNMTATIRVTGAYKGKGLIIPASAIAEIGSRKIVYVENFDKTLSKRDVTVKELNVGEFEVTSGLKAGERIVTQGAYYLKSQEQINSGGGE